MDDMIRFLDGKHNKLAWVHLSADTNPEPALAGKPEADGLHYWLCFWFTNKTCCRVSGSKRVLEEMLKYFNRTYSNVSFGYTKDQARRFAKNPRQMKARPLRDFGIGGKEHPPYRLGDKVARLVRKPARITIRAIRFVLVLFWFCVSFSVAAYFLLAFGYNVYLWQTCDDWPYVAGRVSYVFDGGDRVGYEYTVDGVIRIGSRVSFANDNMAGGRYREGDAVTVYYYPDNPYQCMLARGEGFSANNYIYLGLGVLFAGLGYIAFAWGIGKYETTMDPVYWL